MRDDYRRIRTHISRVVPGCESYEVSVDRPGGFVLPHPPRDSRTFPTASGRAEFTASPIELLQVGEGQLVLQTLRSHDQFNTTIYGLDDRYRGILGGRRVVFVNADDLAALGLANNQQVDLIGHWADDDVERRANGFRVVAYDTPRGCAAAYYPETNPLVPLDSTAEGSNTPTSKSVIISLVPAGTATPAGSATGSAAMDATGDDDSHKSRPEPIHLS
jgi:formate dehydrogenase major subunit